MNVRKKFSLKNRLYLLLLICVIPLTVMITYLLFMINNVSSKYDHIVEKITKANAYNIGFKEDIDYVMYIIVVNSERAEELVDTQKPQKMIKEAREVFGELAEDADSAYAKQRLSRILKSLDTLEKRVQEIEEDALVSGSYETNMESLDLNIRVLGELCDAAVAAGGGDFRIRAVKTGPEEIEVLNKSFNQMVEKIGNLVEDIHTEELNLRAAELRVLQEQINPHFLYNTLDNIIWLAESKKTDEVVMMVSSLSTFFRTSLSKGREFVSVKEETEHIRSYLEIQQFRYRDILDYEIAIPEEYYGYEVIKLTLQPLVENALYHGIKNKRGKGHITVSAERCADVLIFKVKDNGIGMDKQRLAEVCAMLKEDGNTKKENDGFGLFNVNQRIQLHYGTEYGLKVQSTYGEETEVWVRIPVRTESSS